MDLKRSRVSTEKQRAIKHDDKKKRKKGIKLS